VRAGSRGWLFRTSTDEHDPLVGLFGFMDAGRVSVNGDSQGGWHTSAGGGLFLQPVGQPYVLRLGAGTSSEATKLFLGLGLPY